MRCLAIANWAQGDGLSGADNILGQFVRVWSEQHGVEFTVATSESGVNVLGRAGLYATDRVRFHVTSPRRQETWPLPLRYAVWTWASLRFALRGDFSGYDAVYSSSDFWPDSLAGLIVKRRYPRIRWIASVYLFAPNPFMGFHEGSRRLRLPKPIDLFYFLTQRPVLRFTKRWADRIAVTSDPEIDKLAGFRGGRDHVVVVQGGVDRTPSRDYIDRGQYRREAKGYEACFMGRFHRQKGVPELIAIWRLVVDRKPDARLALVGDGPLMAEVRRRVTDAGLDRNVDILGARFGEAKHEIFRQSRMVLHPAVYDSGGMASAEAMAWGLPAVGFDLDAFKTYYPRGMIKVPKGDFRSFAEAILSLLNDRPAYDRLREEAIGLIREVWDFEIRARRLYPSFFGPDEPASRGA